MSAGISCECFEVLWNTFSHDFFLDKGCKRKWLIEASKVMVNGFERMVSFLQQSLRSTERRPISAYDSALAFVRCDRTWRSIDVLEIVALAEPSDLNELDSEGQTALHFATMMRDWYRTRILVHLGASGEAENVSGQTALDCLMSANENESSPNAIGTSG